MRGLCRGQQQPDLCGLLFFLFITMNIVGAEFPINVARSAAKEAGDEVATVRSLGKVFTAVAKNVKPAVVYIETLTPTQVVADPFQLFNDEFARRFFQRNFPSSPSTQLAKGMGSGFLISPEGQIVTNAHVVSGAQQITVKLADNREMPARIIGVDEKNDIALIKIERKIGEPIADALPALTFGDSDQLEVGEWVLAIGNPFGLAQTVTSGIVSAKERNAMGITDYEDFIQTDAAINPGNSGGPLVNLDGEVVGLNTAIFSKSGGYMGIGFSIPSNAVRQVIQQLATHGEFTPGYFGALVAERDAQRGVVIEQIMPASPAQMAGLKIGDVILSINGRAVADRRTFNNIIGVAGAEAEFALVYLPAGRGEEQTITVKLHAPEKEKSFNDPVFGLQVRALLPNDYIERKAPLIKGVLIEECSPAAAALGLLPGTIIVKINNRATENLDQYRELAAAAARRNYLELLVWQNGRFRQIPLRLR